MLGNYGKAFVSCIDPFTRCRDNGEELFNQPNQKKKKVVFLS